MADASTTEHSVTDSAEKQQYELRVGGEVHGVAAYGLGDGTIIFTHTKIDPSLEGQGLGSALAAYALDDARARGLTVVPECPFIAAYLDRHPEYADLVSYDEE